MKDYFIQTRGLSAVRQREALLRPLQKVIIDAEISQSPTITVKIYRESRPEEILVQVEKSNVPHQ